MLPLIGEQFRWAVGILFPAKARTPSPSLLGLLRKIGAFLASFLFSRAFFSYTSHQANTDSGNMAVISTIVLTLIGIAAGISEGRRKAFI
jgi:hypothetical protein